MRTEIMPLATEDRPKDRIGRVLGRSDPNCASRLVPQLAQCIQLGVDLLEPRRDAVQQPFAGFRRRDAASCASQQADANTRLQVTDGLAQR